MKHSANIKGDVLDAMANLVRALQKFRLDIERALWYGGNTHSFDHVCARAISGDLDAYVLPNSLLLCEHDKYPNASVYNVYVACGDLDEILAFQREALEHEARLRGCDYLTFTGRKGWEKVLKQEGWDSKLITMHKEVSYGQDE